LPACGYVCVYKMSGKRKIHIAPGGWAYILWHICSKQEFWSPRNSRCYAMAAKEADIPDPFRGNGSVNTYTRKGIMQLLGCSNGKGVLLRWPVPRENKWDKIWSLSVCVWVQARVEAGSNTSTVALRVAGGDENCTQCLGVKPGHPLPGGYKYGDLALQVGEVSNLRL
jgi:hypothetical protein